jgi:hypothetical protein
VHLPGQGGPQHAQRQEIVNPALEPVLIRDLIFPDRYDLLSRAKYALWLKENRSVWNMDELALLRLARETTRWGIETDMLTYMWQYWTYGAERRYPGPHHEAFHADTRKFYGAMDSLEENGWLPNGYIQIIWGRKLLRGIDGRQPSRYYRKWFMADAQHRVCCWLALHGQTVFAPEQVQVLDYKRYRPFVTTPAFIECGLLSGYNQFRRELDEFLDQTAHSSLVARYRVQ